jgi:hypothetical protein
VHSISFVSHINVTLLDLRQLACFYPKCMDDNVGFCENKLHVQPWMLHMLEPHNITQVRVFKFNLYFDLIVYCTLCMLFLLLFQVDELVASTWDRFIIFFFVTWNRQKGSCLVRRTMVQI